MNQQRPKVWFVGSGRLRLRIPLMNVLRERGFELAAVGPEACDAFAQHGYSYFRYPLRRAVNPFADRQAQQVLVDLFREHRPDIVHAVNTKPSLLAPLAARKAGVPAAIRTITGLGAVFSTATPLTLALRPVYRFLFRRTSHITARTVFQNTDDRDYFLHHGLVDPPRAEVIFSSGIHVEEFRERAGGPDARDRLRRELGLEGRFVVLTITRLLRSKGIPEFLDAAARVRRVLPEAAFVIVGNPVTEGPDGVPLDVIRNSPDVMYLGARNDIPDVLAASDVFALPSFFREGIPRVLLEAAAMERPLITTAAPGCREVVQDGENGVLIPPKDAAALADAVLHLHGRADREQMGRRGREFVSERFHLLTVADQYEQLYRQVLCEVGRPVAPSAPPLRRAA